MALLIPIAFIAGVITVFTPCILPVLPIILAGGTAGSKRRPYAIVAGLVASFTAFVLAGAWIWSLIGVDDKYQKKIGAVLLLVVALTLILPKAGELLERPFLFLTRRRAGDLGGGFFLGASLGLVFVPCAGPVLAAVSASVGSHKVGGETVVTTIAYAIGAALPMLIIARGSRRATISFRTHAQTIRIVAGAAIAATAVVLYQDPRWLTDLQTNVPGYASSIENWFTDNHTASNELAKLQGHKPAKQQQFSTTQPQNLKPLAVASKPVKVALNDYGAAPDFHGISHWLNTPGDRSLSLQDLHGKVVLIDFWTYSCINCLRTLPHLEEWNRLYGSKGLVIVGVHTPEFAFEHDLGNVTDATKRLGVRYPVALDNDYGTWNAYSNQYWPAEYLLDQSGHVRHIHFGEGEYDKTEHDIRLLLEAGGRSALPVPVREPDTTPTGDITPETYLGYFRIARYAGSRLSADVETSYRFPTTLARDAFAYSGRWKVESEKIVAGADARLRLHFHARKVHLVLGGKGLVGEVVDGRTKGAIRVNGDRLYTLVSEPRNSDGTLELAFTPGVQAYAFTFG
jgi:cytochrome c biogenesis protein CcdA/thiol-disulfide isomerase/thioredoxin